MANTIDIKEFDGVITNADVEDLPENVAQEIKNLKIEAGRLTKTFGAGTPSGIPNIGMSIFDSSFSPSRTYVVYNIFTFVSDKLSGDLNDAGDGYRYLLVTIEQTSQNVQLFWWDSSKPDVSGTLQVQNDVLIVNTASAHGMSVTNKVLIQDCKNNASPQADLSSAGTYDTVDTVPSSTKMFVNTDQAPSFGGSFFATTPSTDHTSVSWGGWHNTHLQMTESVSVDSPADAQSKIDDIAVCSSNGKVLTMAITKSRTRMVFSTGSTFAEPTTSIYATHTPADRLKFASICTIGSSIYVHISYQKSSTVWNKVYRYSLDVSGNLTETLHIDLSNTSDHITTSYMYYMSTRGYLYILSPDLGLKQVAISSASVSDVTIPTNATGMAWMGLTSITAPSGKDYLIIGETKSNGYQLHQRDMLDGSVSSFTSMGSALNEDLKYLTRMDFNQVDSSGNYHESLVIAVKDTSNNYTFKYSTHNTPSDVVTAYANVVDINSSSSGTLGTAIASGTNNITLLKEAYNSPSGSKYLIVGTDDYSSPSLTTGMLFRIAEDGVVTTLANPSADKGWNPTCFSDTTTDNSFFTYAKGYVAVWGVESSYGSPTPTEAGSISRMTDIGWQTGTWAGNGDCEYRWINITGAYSSTDVDQYHKEDRNPVIPNGDTLRFLPGNIGKVGSNEAKGIWAGYIDRSLFNGATVLGPGFYADANRLTNPFSFKGAEFNITDEEIRTSDTVKYTVTALYDHIQETEIDNNIKIVCTNDDTSTDVSKSEIRIIVDLPRTTMSNRITGINLYRAEKISGVYEPYKLIKNYSFVDTDVPSATSTELNISVEAFPDYYLFLKDTSTSPSLDTWLTSGTISSDGSGVEGTDPDHDYSWSTAEREYAIKVGSYEKQKITNIDAIMGYAQVGSVRLGQDLDQLASGADLTGTSIKVTSITGITNSTEYYIGRRRSVIEKVGDSGSNEDDDNSFFIFTSPDVSDPDGGQYESIYTTTVDTTQSADSDGLYTIVVTRGYEAGGDTNGDYSRTLAHSKYSPVKASSLTSTGWYRVITDDPIERFAHDDSWKIYRENFGPGWHRTDQPEGDSGCFAGGRMGVVMPKESEATDGTFSMAPWRDTDGTMKLSELTNKAFTATGGVYTDGSGGSLPATDKSFKIESVYTTWDEQLGFTFIKTDKNFQRDNWVDKDVQIKSSVEASVDTNDNEITFNDTGLSSLGEHPYAGETKIAVNAQYGKILKGRLFLGNVVLDPGNENESQNDWLIYSELDAYDVRPVSNAIPFPDREGGQITGLAELFGRLIIFKAQAIYVLDIVDPTAPTSWVRKESKINIGNIAPEGIVEVHDSVFFVHHDGIYQIDSNTVASANATPSILEKITLPIEDQFLSANSKRAVKGIYDQKNNELLYTWSTGSPATQVVWAYHIVNKVWRKVETTTNLDILTFGENSGPVTWDNTDKDIKKFDIDEAVGTAWKSKRFSLDLDQKRLLRYGMVKFTGTDTLTMNIYLDGAGSPSFTKTITADGGINRFPIKRYGKNFEMELTTPSSTNAFSVERLRIETE